MSIKSVIENYENGNLSDARHGAKRHSEMRIFSALRNQGKRITHAGAIAGYLKGTWTYRQHCEVLHKD